MAVLILIDADCFFVCKPLGYIVFVIVASSFSLFLGDIDKFDVITLGNVGPEILAPLDGYTTIAAPSLPTTTTSRTSRAHAFRYSAEEMFTT